MLVSSSHLSEGLPNKILHVFLSLLILSKYPNCCKVDFFTLNALGVWYKVCSSTYEWYL